MQCLLLMQAPLIPECRSCAGSCRCQCDKQTQHSTRCAEVCAIVFSVCAAHVLFVLCTQAPLNPSGLVVGGAAASVISGPKVFTDIAFEAASSGMQLRTQHMYVSSASGAVFQVNYGR